LRADADALDAFAAAAVADVRSPDGGWLVEPLSALLPAVRTRALRLMSGGAASASQVAAMDALVTRWHGQGAVSLPGGHVMRRVAGRLLVESAS
jgi:tRNA(Ile)-lysidine synthase